MRIVGCQFFWEKICTNCEIHRHASLWKNSWCRGRESWSVPTAGLRKWPEIIIFHVQEYGVIAVFKAITSLSSFCIVRSLVKHKRPLDCTGGHYWNSNGHLCSTGLHGLEAAVRKPRLVPSVQRNCAVYDVRCVLSSLPCTIRAFGGSLDPAAEFTTKYVSTLTEAEFSYRSHRIANCNWWGFALPYLLYVWLASFSHFQLWTVW